MAKTFMTGPVTPVSRVRIVAHRTMSSEGKKNAGMTGSAHITTRDRLYEQQTVLYLKVTPFLLRSPTFFKQQIQIYEKRGKEEINNLDVQTATRPTSLKNQIFISY